MTEYEIKQIIWREVNRTLNVLLTGVSANADGQGNEDITNFVPGAGPIQKRPVAFPYGYNAQTPDNIPQLIATVGNHPLNRMVLGHFDVDRPVVKSGEVVLYNNFGQQVYLKNGKVLIGSPSASQPVPLGTVLQTFLEDLLNALVAHTHTSGIPGSPTSPPLAPALTTFTQILASPIQDGSLLSQETFVEATNPGDG